MRILGSLVAVLLLAGCAASPEIVTTEPSRSAESVEAQTEPTAQESAEQSEEATEESPAEQSEPQASETAKASPSPTSTSTARATATPRPTATSRPTPTQEPPPSPDPTVTAGPVFVSRAEVAKNNTRSSCWAIIDGSVYNLTRWIAQHPGGTSAILRLCGTDATSAFDGQHGGQSGPSSVLDDYFIALLED